MAVKREEVLEMINRYKIIAILRNLPMDAYKNTAEALYQGGIRLIEIPFDQSGKYTADMIREQIATIRTMFPDVAVGAGTVMTREQVDAAREADAAYVLSPGTDKEIIEYTRAVGLVSIPGAFTPTEIQNAYRWGADYVKLFPAGGFGTDYLKDITAPLSHIRFLAVGRIDIDNMEAFLKAGCVGVGVGSCLVDKGLVREGRYDELKNLAVKYVARING